MSKEERKNLSRMEEPVRGREMSKEERKNLSEVVR